MSLNFPLISEGPTSENLTFKMEGRVKLEIELRISCSDTMLNYRLSQKLKLLGNCEFNHLTISLTSLFKQIVTGDKVLPWFISSEEVAMFVHRRIL